ncbi:hypothetical protein B0A48_17836 [Cryoendolithus antarcticus]|uniref:Uncharacterized protein n=1 Tax=Cryoendolithus antarcticus TaxID=1507870 RepID=A0A1V8SAP3_9PEZI|nr:hypothetical protein B0A48_17836 [Cryoendolithus antarcticus]
MYQNDCSNRAPLECLPLELLEYIFENLRADHQRHIAACRLVCRTLSLHSSPFLITELVIANRLYDVARAQRILDHPIFSQQVSTLIYDASLYPDNPISDHSVEVNSDELTLASRDRPLRNEQDAAQQAGEFRMLDLLGLREAHHLDSPRSEISHAEMRSVTGQPESPSHTQMRTLYYQHKTLGTFDSHLRHVSYIGDQRLITKTDIIPGLIRRAFSEAPKLDRLIFTDWRGLGENGVSHGDFCIRPFGNVLERGQWQQLSIALQAVGQSGRHLKQLDIGDNLFASGSSGEDLRVMRVPGIDLPCLSKTLEHGPHFIDYNWLAKNLQTLSLPILFASDESENMEHCRRRDVPAMKSILRILAPNILDLTLSLSCTKSWRAHSTLDALSGVRRIKPFLDIPKDITFPHLEMLHLDGWPFSASELADFLTDSAPALRYLHLTNCIVNCTEPDFSDFTTSPNPFVDLHGLEISSLHFSHHLIDPSADWTELYALVEGAEHEVERQNYETVVSFAYGGAAVMGNVEYERGVEEILLRGRENKIRRRAKPRRGRADEGEEKCWEVPHY